MSQQLATTRTATNYKSIGTTGNTLIKSGGGQVSSVIVGKGQSGASMTVYDGVDATGTLMGVVSLDMSAPGAWTPPAPVAFSRGLFVVTAGLTTGSVTFLYN